MQISNRDTKRLRTSDSHWEHCFGIKYLQVKSVYWWAVLVSVPDIPHRPHVRSVKGPQDKRAPSMFISVIKAMVHKRCFCADLICCMFLILVYWRLVMHLDLRMPAYILGFFFYFCFSVWFVPCVNSLQWPYSCYRVIVYSKVLWARNHLCYDWAIAMWSFRICKFFQMFLFTFLKRNNNGRKL